MVSEITTDVFIAALRKQPCLYDKRNVNSKNKLIREEAWRTIINELGGEFNSGNVDAMKMRWRSLKDCYLKHKRANNSLLSSRLNKQYKNWRWAPYLQFLDPHMPVRDALILGKNNVRFRARKTQMKKEIPDDFDSTETNQRFSEVFLNVPERKKDDIYHLFASYAETFRKFSPKRQVILKMEMANLFLKAEMKHLEETGCPIQNDTLNIGDLDSE